MCYFVCYFSDPTGLSSTRRHCQLCVCRKPARNSQGDTHDSSVLWVAVCILPGTCSRGYCCVSSEFVGLRGTHSTAFMVHCFLMHCLCFASSVGGPRRTHTMVLMIVLFCVLPSRSYPARSSARGHSPCCLEAVGGQ